MKKTLLKLMLFVFTFSNAQLVSTIAGSGFQQTADGTGINANFNKPNGIVKDSDGNFFVAEEVGRVIRKITPAGVVTTFAGDGINGFLDGNGTSARFGGLGSLAIDSQNNIYVGDYGNAKIRKITPTGDVTTFVNIDFPYGICIDPTETYLYVVGTSRIVKRVTIANGNITNIAGSIIGGNINGIGAEASFGAPFGVVVDPTNTYLYVSDFSNNNIRKVTLATQEVSLLAGGFITGSADGIGSGALFSSPIGITCDTNGNVYTADHFNNKIRKITTNGVVTTIAGSGDFGGDNGSAETATFTFPIGLIFDASGDLIVTEYDGSRVRRITGVFLSNASFNDISFNLYPNPAHDILNIETETELKSVLIYSIHGQKVLSSDDKQINISHLSSGIYMVRVQDVNDAVATQKLVKKL